MSDDHGHSHAPTAATSALVVALAMSTIFVIAEVAGGIIFKSLALAADAAHQVSDIVALVIALVAARVAARPASNSHSFGWRRIEVLAAFSNGVLLLAVSAWIILEAVQRFGNPPETNAAGLTVVAAVGLAVNLVATVLLHRKAQGNVNVRAAAMHTLSDAAGSFGALLAGVVLAVGGPGWADPLASIVIALLVIVAAVRLMRETAHVLLEATPPRLDPDEITAVLSQQANVLRVHHLHVWSVAADQPSLSAHVELSDVETLHEAQAYGDRLKTLLAERFDVHHSTLELECHPCAPGDEKH